MRFHDPVVHKQFSIPAFVEKNRELAAPQGIFTREEYPNLPDTLVKIPAQDGKNIYVPMSKLKHVSMADL
jgi:hypothetical protein